MEKIIVLTTLLLLLSACEFEQAIPHEEGSIQVFFCPQECEGVLKDFSSKTLQCAFFDYEEDILPLQHAQLLIDSDNHEHRGIPVSSSGYMHNKFCLLENKMLWTGSMNPTENGIKKNNNNILLIDSDLLYENYEAEFEELQTKRKRPTPNEIINLSGIIIENYFCPEDNCKDQIIEELQKASSSVYFMTFSFTHKEIAQVLIEKHIRDVTIEGVFEKRHQSHTVKPLLEENGIRTHFDNNKATMHHKVFIIDEKTVITGSMNPSKNGDTRNDENMLIIHDKNTAKKFLEEFERVKE